MVGGDSMGPGLQLVRARFLNFLLAKLSREFKLRPVSIFHQTQMATFRYASRYSHMVRHADSARRTVYVDVTLIRSKVKIKVTEHLNFRHLP